MSSKIMWAGLLASSCTKDGQDDGNLLFLTLLRQLSACEVRIITEICEKAEKYLLPGGWPGATKIKMTLHELINVSGVSDALRIDREMDHLRSLELVGIGDSYEISGGFHPDSTDAYLQPTNLALHLYVRGQGFVGSPAEYWNLKKAEPPPLGAPDKSEGDEEK